MPDEIHIHAELDRLIGELPSCAAERARCRFDEAVAQATGGTGPLVLFGAGGLGRKTLAGLRQAGIEPAAFSDNNASLWGTQVEGVSVLSPAEAAKRYAGRALFVVTIWRAGGHIRIEDARRQLLGLGCNAISFGPLYWKYPETFLPYYALDLPQKLLAQAHAVREAAEIWSDEQSRQVFLAQVRWRLCLDFAALTPPVDGVQYFPDQLFNLHDHEVFVDCGAFDGDTLESFLARRGPEFSSFVALEPDPINFRKLEAFRASLADKLREKVRLLPLAVGNSGGKIRFNATGTGASAIGATKGGNGAVEVHCVRLDDCLAGLAPTYIKMDIEGAEPAALEGARGLIDRHAPILAVCVYHQQDHLWQIPLWLRRQFPNYRLFLRPHEEDCWDVVCYAVPEHRLTLQNASPRGGAVAYFAKMSEAAKMPVSSAAHESSRYISAAITPR